MSRFFSQKYNNLVPYTPGEQPKDMNYIKLNTNESPYPPSPSVSDAVKEESNYLMLYSDPECKKLNDKIAEIYGVTPEQVITTNGSDEALNFAFMAFADKDIPLVFPDITYGFYPVYGELNHIPYEEIPVSEKLEINVEDYIGINKTIVIANPNAPTGRYLELVEIEEILKNNSDNVVIIDEAYIDFGGESAISLVDRYDNLLVIQTYSKSRSMAGARLGYAIGNKELITDMNRIKYSTNPYNVNRLTAIAGYVALVEDDYYKENAKKIMEDREWFTKELNRLGFSVLESKANFVFASHMKITGETWYQGLKKKGILVRHFKKERIQNYIRITIGTKEQMETCIRTLEVILEEQSI